MQETSTVKAIFLSVVLLGSGLALLLASDLAHANEEAEPEHADLTLEQLQHQAGSDDATAQVQLGLMYATGDNPSLAKDLEKAHDLFSRASSQNEPEGSYYLAEMYFLGVGVVKNTERAINLYEHAAMHGHGRSGYVLFQLYSDGKPDPEDHVVLADTYLIGAAANGFPAAMNDYGYSLEKQGNGFDSFQAQVWYRKAADKGFAKAFYNLGRLAEDDLVHPSPPIDYPLAVEMYEKAIDGNDAYAMYRLGMMLAEGKGVRQNLPRALDLLVRAAEAGVDGVWFALGRMHTVGDTFRKNEAQAIDFFGRVSGEDRVVAQYNIGYLSWSLGKYQLAIDHFTKAAQAGHASAQNYLGIAYKEGKGVDRNYADALYWFAKAAQQGDAHAPGNMRPVLRQRAWKVVAGNSVNLRGDPSTANAPLASLAKGTRVYPLSSKEDWKLIYVEDGHKLGWISTELLGSRPSALPTASASSDPWPAKPATRPGAKTCRTRCVNGDCYRTYSSGKKVRFQAMQKFNPLTNRFEWDSGGC